MGKPVNYEFTQPNDPLEIVLVELVSGGNIAVYCNTITGASQTQPSVSGIDIKASTSGELVGPGTDDTTGDPLILCYDEDPPMEGGATKRVVMEPDVKIVYDGDMISMWGVAAVGINAVSSSPSGTPELTIRPNNKCNGPANNRTGGSVTITTDT